MTLDAPTEIQKRTAGQDIGSGGQAMAAPSDRIGHKADPESFMRSRNKVYKRKVIKQRKAKNK